jgi:hypothetical protein
MSTIASEGEAVSALVDANSVGEQASPPEAGVTGATEQDSFEIEGIDPNALPPELQTIYKSMQRGFNQKIEQEVLPYRQLGLGPQEAQQYISFVDALQNDPQTQLQVFNALQGHLQSLGYSPQQAQAAAAQAVNEQASGLEDDLGDDYGYDPRVDELENEIANLRNWQQQQTLISTHQQIEANLDRAESAIRQANPNYTDTDIEDIYRLAHSTNYNLFEAQQQYEQLRQRMMGGYLEQKASVTAPMPVPGGGHAAAPKKFERLDDPELERTVQGILAHYLNQN